MKVHVFGGGKSVGSSCVVVEGKEDAILFDCGYNPVRPDVGIDFSRMNAISSKIRAICITHFHVDHVGMLPWLTKFMDVPIYLSEPTQALLSLIINDIHSGNNLFCQADFDKCILQCKPIDPTMTKRVTQNLSIRCIYAGHALGAVMYEILLDGKRIVYSGDFDVSPSFLLRGAEITSHAIDYLITESTCINEQHKRRYELYHYADCLLSAARSGGSVQIVVNGIGRGQEVMGIVLSIVRRCHLTMPLCCSGGMLTKIANEYKKWKNWLRDDVHELVDNFSKYQMLSAQTNYIAITTPATLTKGHSLEVFEKIKTDPKSFVILPSYVSSNPKTLKETGYQCKIIRTEDNNHSDGFGLQEAIRALQPKEVFLVHGDPLKMQKSQVFFQKLFNLPVHMPNNNEALVINDSSHKKKKKLSKKKVNKSKPPRLPATLIEDHSKPKEVKKLLPFEDDV
ncbi:metallo-beta-lactamase family protein [Entamoeba histolytica HM-1:IMSS-B]|uniref:Metallo-beta-lactamase family protein n=6 Tax=Entamoeba histolytica TaxID=5759 RepID=C4LTF4_ENTH1|nr:metallo-beta-lactamase family protein [Entamoeba histolytica HM-1:IMSS]EMD49202.1 cleavage and polyadenylation specificity factor, putative [Entamoeba histolytica KU27]EMH77628.1 metallo-beta-lactamase family protein [Entamoeba histolytica HM-1:IMSS-B]EMS12241.1 cleavage and polyadenylation specificity factor, putative [Entamoeba histolytica HM-3:IMSS]ENY65056.1 cleavage and polyadenylation specificity factor, putative [Entamoeba histolytica HM-1:IMSS-A]GAT91840.1 metallo-beta-lactamase fam|eukprot:XP_653580.1 metallo-beta-lactamase family protein [Entamoeba histolytica HM-1:IMSS]